GHELDQRRDGRKRMTFEGEDDGQSTAPDERTREHRNAMVGRQVCKMPQWVKCRSKGMKVGDPMSEAVRTPAAATGLDIAGRRAVAVMVPCFNEEAAIGSVVANFRTTLPQAAIYVYDNNSTDRTVELARAAGAIVRREAHQGKGNVVRRMFADVD